MGFLPVNEKEIRKNGWDAADFVIVTGDAYVDHPSFGTAIISRVLEHAGYKVAILPQPDFTDEESITACGKPGLAFLVNAGNMDSMVNHYTAAKKPRSEDAYSPGGKAGRRPDRAVIVYCNMIRKKYGKIPVVIGGIEASLRRLGHYDYWQDKMRRSVLLDSGADILSYGMGEHSVVEIADLLAAGKDVSEITSVRGTVVKARELPKAGGADATGSDSREIIELPSFDEISKDKKKYAESFGIQYENTDPFTAKPLAEKYGENRYVVQNVPALPLTTDEMDMVYGLPYMGEPHPMYEKEGGIPAIEEVRFSLTSTRGCFGSCSFCALSFHEGRIVQARSHESILKEAEKLTRHPQFKGYLHDVGGPTADFRFPACEKQCTLGACKDRQCLYPKPCPNLRADHSDYTELLKKIRKLPGVKKVFVRSGIRFDYVMEDIDRCRKEQKEKGRGRVKNTGEEFLDELTKYHVSGQLRVAPEHVSDSVLKLMGKPGREVYIRFLSEFEKSCKRTGMEKQYVVPYLISSHPGSELKDAVALAEAIRDMGYMPEQVQDFYPTPSTLSTCMYYTGLDPRTGKEVRTVRDPHEKAMQRALLQYRKPENWRLVKEALLKAGRADLIGFDKRKCLIPPRELRRKT